MNRMIRMVQMFLLMESRLGVDLTRTLFRCSCISLVSLLTLSALFGCRGSDVEPDPFAGKIEVVESATSKKSNGPLVSTSGHGERRGGVFKFPGYYALIPDPVFVEYFGWMLVAELYSGLTRIVNDPGGFVHPDLADRWTVSDDGFNYEFVLRRNLKFSDGSPVTAIDFKWSWERALDPYNRSERAQDVFGNVVGALAVIGGATSDLEGLTVIDDRTLRITLQQAQTDFPAQLADPVAAVLKRENVEKWGYDLAGWWAEPQRVPVKMKVMPVGTGPFKLVEFDANGKSVIERNAHYAHRQAYLDAVEFTMRFEGSPDYYDISAQGFDGGEFDIAFFGDDDPEQFDPTSEDMVGILVYNEQPRETRFFAFNASLPPYDDRHFRRALSAATNAEAFTAERATEPAYSLLPPDMPGHDAYVTAIQRDPVVAVDELEQSRYGKDGEEWDLVFTEAVWGWSEAEVKTLSKDWKDALGLNLVYTTTYAPNLADAYKENEIQMVYIRAMPEYPDPHVVLREFVPAFGEGNDSTEYAVAGQMLGVASKERDAAKRLERYAELEKYILNEALALPFEWFPEGYYVRVQPWVMDWAIPKYHGSTLKDVWFDETVPERELPLP